MTLLELPLHPRLVHFPIALLIVGAVALIIVQWRDTAWLRTFGFVSLLLGWVLTIPAIITGLIDKSALDPASAANGVANQHTTLIFVAWGLYGAALYVSYLWREKMNRARRWQVTMLLVIASLALVVAGDLGGRLVYELGVGVGK